MLDVVVFTALAWERRAVGRALGVSGVPEQPGTWSIRLGAHGRGLLVETGMGTARARAAALAAPAARAWVGIGCAGGLAASLTRGEAIVAREVVVLDGDGRVVDRVPAVSAPLVAAAVRRGVALREGAIATSLRVLDTAAAKEATAAATGALVVDMESGALATVARERGIPFSGLRVVLDLADETLPFGDDVVDARTGAVRMSRALATLALPTHWPAIARLARGQQTAIRVLRTLAGVIGDEGPAEGAASRRAATA